MADASVEAPPARSPHDVLLGVDSNVMAVDERSNSSPPRLMITKMVLENFKSYAGIKEIGPFHKCFSSVVGPNGSGKSNVIDAMLFVFGKRAKQLRLNKVSELIHKSDAVKEDPPRFARVSVHFQEIRDTGDGDNDYDVIPNTERVVSRVVTKDSTSTYKLDGKNCAFKDVAEYLGTKGIDLDNNRFLILQGEVEMISMMAPKGKTDKDDGLLEYLEDIIGSNKFVEETNDAAAQVETLSEQRQEKLNRVKAVEKEKDNLEGAKIEAEALLQKEREIRRKKNIMYQINAMAASKEREQHVSKKQEVVEELEAERLRLKGADERVKEIEGGLSKQTAEYNRIHEELKQTKEEFSAYERRDIKLREEIKHAKADKKKLEAKVKAEAKKEVDAIKKREVAEASIPELEADIIKCTEKKAEEDQKLERIFEEMKAVTDKLRVELEGKTQELAPVSEERAVFQANLDTALTQVKLLEDSTTRAKGKLAAAEKELSSLDSNQSSKRDELASCEDELIMSKQRIIDAEKEEQELAKNEGTLARRNKELLSLAEEAKAALHSQGGRSKAVAGILKASRGNGPLSKVGVLGRLGDLARIPEQYDVAVSTACGMLDHIVVQTTAGAQRCLDFLRKHKLGRANFIPLDKMKKGAHDRAVETPEDAPRLFELITPSNFAITPAIYLAVGNTLVAPDLETATRWAYDFGKRWRVVTIDGKLIETSGTMAGGGKSVRKGGMRLMNSNVAAATMHSEAASIDDCKKLEEEARQGHQQLQECRSRRRELSDEIRSLKKKVKSLSVKLPKLTMEISGYDTTREELTKRLPELRSQCELGAEDESKLKDLNKNVQKCKSDMASCAMLAAKLETEVARLQKAILDAGGSRLKNQQVACEKALAAVKAAEKELNSAKVAIRSNQKAIAKAQKAKATAEKDLESCKAMLEEKQADFKTLENDAFEVMQAYEKVKEVEANRRQALEAVSAECEGLKKSLAEIKCVEIELLGRIETHEKQIGDCEKRLKLWDQEISKLHVNAEEDEAYDESDDETEDDNAEECAADEDGDMQNADAPKTESDNSKSSGTPNGRSSLPTLSFASLEQYSLDEVKKDVKVLEDEHKSLAKNANMGAIAEYRKKESDYLSRVAELDNVTEEVNTARKKHEALRRQRLEMFMDGFGRITLKLKEMYQMITLGGDAELELVDSLDPFSEGIVFSVRPPKKSWKNIANLSGGEKTLSSLALVFALHHYKPTPLYVMDEIDAALDFKNVSIVANYIKERTKNAQFIIISLRNNMFELADRLVGIYKTNNCTDSTTVDPRVFGGGALVPGTPAPLQDKSNTRVSTVGKGSRRQTENDENSMVVS